MAKKVRVYELARELGLDNAETLALCESLGIGVKSASSSMEEAHADRARRKADREGLRREPIVDDEPEDKPAEAPKSVISTRKPPPRRVPPPPGSAAPRRPTPDRPPQRPVGQAAPVPTTPPPGPRPTPPPPAQAPAAPAGPCSGSACSGSACSRGACSGSACCGSPHRGNTATGCSACCANRTRSPCADQPASGWGATKACRHIEWL